MAMKVNKNQQNKNNKDLDAKIKSNKENLRWCKCNKTDRILVSKETKNKEFWRKIYCDECDKAICNAHANRCLVCFQPQCDDCGRVVVVSPACDPSRTRRLWMCITCDDQEYPGLEYYDYT